MITAQSPVQNAQLRMAHHYLTKLKKAESASRRGRENQNYWLNQIHQDWEQIKQWQAWSAAWKDTDLARAHVCATFPVDTAAALRVRLTTSEQFDWVQQALDAAQKIHDSKAEHFLLYQLGFLSLSMELPDQAEQYAHRLMECAQVAHDDFNVGRAYFLLGAVAFIRSQYEQAEEVLSTSLARLQTCAASEETGQVYLGLGRVANVRGDYQQAHRYYRQYLDSSIAADNEHAILEAHLSMSGIYLAMEDYPAAKEHAHHAITMARPLGISRFLPPALFSLAHGEKAQGDYENACVHYEEGIDAARAVGSAPSTIANGLHGLGQVKYFQGDYIVALSHFEAGLIIVREAHFLLRVCEIAHDMVFVHLTCGETEAARTRLQEALSSAQQLGTPHFMAKALAAAVALWQHLGKAEQAAAWAGLLSGYISQITPSLFSPAVFDQLEAELGKERYHEAIKRGKALTLEDTVSEILTLLNSG